MFQVDQYKRRLGGKGDDEHDEICLRFSIWVSFSLLSPLSLPSFLPFCDPMSYRISIEGVTIGVHYESSAFKCILFLCLEGNWGIVIDERVKSFFDVSLNIIIHFENVVARCSIRDGFVS